MFDLKTKEGRASAIEKIESDFLKELKNNKIELFEGARCRVYDDSIRLFIVVDVETEKQYFASEITLYSSRFDGLEIKRENEINFGTSGSFTPNDLGSYWRTIHATSILKNWFVVSEIVNKFCKKYSDLSEEIFSLNIK
jgi:hypothetical protein